MIKIMVDSASDCGIGDGVADIVIPLTVTVAGKEYRAGVDLSNDAFYTLLTTTGEFPQTSQPSPEAFAAEFEKIKEAGDEVICLTLSSALSGTYQSAMIAKAMTDYEGIYILDTLCVTHMIGILAKYARDLIGQGLSAPEIVAKCGELRSKIKVFAGISTLEYLYKGGRMSRASAAVGEIAGIKPIITLTEEGTISAANKAIGVPRAVQVIVNKLKGSRLDPRFPVYTLCNCDTENLELLEKKLAAAEYTVAGRLQVGPTIGTHAGPGVYGVVFVTE